MTYIGNKASCFSRYYGRFSWILVWFLFNNTPDFLTNSCKFWQLILRKMLRYFLLPENLKYGIVIGRHYTFYYFLSACEGVGRACNNVKYDVLAYSKTNIKTSNQQFIHVVVVGVKREFSRIVNHLFSNLCNSNYLEMRVIFKWA